MLDTEEQLKRLKQRVAAIDEQFLLRKRAAIPPITPARAFEKPERARIEEWSDGQVVVTEHGEHFETERSFASHKPHGSADIGALCELPHDLLEALSGGEVPNCCPTRWAFLDTETTGLAGGSGTYAFLIGVGRITPEGFRVRQFFLREYAEERSLFSALTKHLEQFDVLVTYNGRTFDVPLLQTRYRMLRQRPPFDRTGHLDLLYGARRLWKLRLENCKLMQLERQILGVEREGDLAGELIPHVYFDYLRSREATRLIPIFHHNAIDILSLACLTAIVPAAFRNTELTTLARLGIRHGEDLAGIARWLLMADQAEAALAMLRNAVAAGLPDPLLFRTLWDIGCIEKKRSGMAAAMSSFTELAGCRNPYRVNALVELAKYYEHEERNLAIALQWTEEAMRYDSTPALLARQQRLEKRMAKVGNHNRTRKLPL